MNGSFIRNAVLVGAIVSLVAGVAVYRQRTQPITPGFASAAATQATGMPRMIDLGADKCIPCKAMAPILVELTREYAGRATIEFIDVWKNQQAGEPYGVRIIPTQIFFDREGKEVWRHEGFLPKADIVAKLKELGVG
ncbi:MAG: thioredoxin family protein [Phycisphaerae bacterium]|nr:thioredoxin family protein [Phycisphaerae bacterium]